MTEKNISIECWDCLATFPATRERAEREECPNCHGDNITVLDEI